MAERAFDERRGFRILRIRADLLRPKVAYTWRQLYDGLLTGICVSSREGEGRSMEAGCDVNRRPYVRSNGALGRRKQRNHRGKLSANWGCVALLAPEDFLNGPDRDERTALLANWANRVTQDTDYGRASFSAKDRKAAGGNVIDAGRLKISWPTLNNGKPLRFNLLLATVTDPKIGRTVTKDYPSPQNIAKAWNDAPEYTYYFRCNRLAGIQTADDSEIEKFLKK